ncbi:MAG: tryptophan synthase subunit alpha [Actinomycetota bacterium]
MTEAGTTRLATMFAEARAGNRAVLLPYLTAGIPSPDESVAIFQAMADAGADGFEVGIPYADPLMDGPVIMEAGERALEQGVTVAVALDIVRRVSESTGKPVLAMTYVNPVLHRGIDTFFREAADAGAAGVIIADLPANESAPFRAAALDSGLGLALFVAPTTDDERLDAVLAADPSFVYAVAEVGVTGERESASLNTDQIAARIGHRSDVPIVFGVGISTPAMAGAAAAHGDGVIVGTAIVRRVLEAGTGADAINAVSGFVSDLRRAVQR